MLTSIREKISKVKQNTKDLVKALEEEFHSDLISILQ